MKIKVKVTDLIQSISLMESQGLDSQVIPEGYNSDDYFEVDTFGKMHIVDSIHKLMIKQTHYGK